MELISRDIRKGVVRVFISNLTLKKITSDTDIFVTSEGSPWRLRVTKLRNYVVILFGKLG